MSDLTNAPTVYQHRWNRRLRYADEYDMSIDDRLLQMVGFVVKDGKPCGTCFLVRVHSELHPDRRWWDHGYLITAEHVAPPDGQPREVWMVTAKGDFVRDLRPQWLWPAGLGDIAVAPFLSALDDRPWTALPLYQDAVDTVGIKQVQLGAIIHYIGLLNPLSQMADRGQPMVRTAYLGARYVPNVSYEGARGRITVPLAAPHRPSLT